MLAVLGALVTLTCWAISSPPGSAPDELYHLNSIWCGHGIDEDLCQPGADDSFRLVPHQVTTPQCFTQNTLQSAECRTDDNDDPMTPDTPANIGNWNGNQYPRVYYFVMSAFVLDAFDPSVILMRTVNGILTVLLVAGLAWLLPRRLRNVGPLAFLATAVPLSMFTLASANPSSWAVLSGGITWLAIYGAYELRGRRQAAVLGLAVVAALMGAGARTDAALISILGVAVALALRWGRLRSQWKTTLVAASAAGVSLAMYFATSNAGVVTSGLGGYEPAPVSDSVLLLSNALQVPFLWMSAVGAGPLSSLGWFDTPIPWLVGFGSTLTCGALLFYGWASMWWQKMVALGLVGLALTAYPLIILQQSHIYVGNGVQPRYVLPMLVMFAGVSLLPAVGHRMTLNRTQVVVLAALLSVAHSISLYMNLWRYVRGITEPWESIGDYTWWWEGLSMLPLFTTPMATWLVGSCAFAVTATWLLWSLVPAREALGVPTAARDEMAGHPDGEASGQRAELGSPNGDPGLTLPAPSQPQTARG